MRNAIRPKTCIHLNKMTLHQTVRLDINVQIILSEKCQWTPKLDKDTKLYEYYKEHECISKISFVTTLGYHL
jgi:hypothetical protein